MPKGRHQQEQTSPPRREWSTLAILAFMVATLAVLYLAKEIFIPFAFALALSFILTQPSVWLERIHLGRVPSVLIVVAAVVAATAGVGWIVANQLVEVVDHLPAYGENIHNKIQGIRSPATGALGRVEKSIAEIAKDLATPDAPASRSRRTTATNATHENPLPVEVIAPDPSPLASLRDLTLPILGPVAMFGFVLILTVFILIEREDLRNRLLRLVGISQLHATTKALDDATQRISRYLVLQFLVNAMMGAAIGICLAAIGVPYAPLWGVLAALLRLVPYVGIICAALLPFTLSLAVFDGWMHPALVLVLFFTLEMIVGNFLEPWLYGAHTGISSLGLLVSTIFWTILWGYPGLILSTPLTVCVAVLGRYVPQLSFLHIMLGDEDVLSTEIHLYQRLLAMDHVEARAVVERFLKDRPHQELYEQVLIPTLILAEQDRHRGTLDEHREEFIFLCLNEIIAELAEQGTPAKTHPSGRVFIVPAKDAADEVSASLFAQLLEREGYAVISFPAGSIEDLSLLCPSSGDLICICALPPFAFAAAAKLCAEVRKQHPEVRILAAIWGFPEGREQLLSRLEKSTRGIVATTLAQALEQAAAPVPVESATSA
jgi:predicted PurR-regulated permease PerM